VISVSEYVTDNEFQSSQKCENFYEKFSLYDKPVQSIITDFLHVRICAKFNKVDR